MALPIRADGGVSRADDVDGPLDALPDRRRRAPAGGAWTQGARARAGTGARGPRRRDRGSTSARARPGRARRRTRRRRRRSQPVSADERRQEDVGLRLDERDREAAERVPDDEVRSRYGRGVLRDARGDVLAREIRGLDRHGREPRAPRAADPSNQPPCQAPWTREKVAMRRSSHARHRRQPEGAQARRAARARHAADLRPRPRERLQPRRAGGRCAGARPLRRLRRDGDRGSLPRRRERRLRRARRRTPCERSNGTSTGCG